MAGQCRCWFAGLRREVCSDVWFQELSAAFRLTWGVFGKYAQFQAGILWYSGTDELLREMLPERQKIQIPIAQGTR